MTATEEPLPGMVDESHKPCGHRWIATSSTRVPTAHYCYISDNHPYAHVCWCGRKEPR
jgi:hypothetical protein